MKILQLIDSLEIGGAERMAVNIANVLCDFHIENVIVCTRAQGALISFLPKNASLFKLDKKSSFDFFAFFKLIQIVRGSKPNIIHVHSTSLIWGVLIRIFYLNAKIVWHDHYGNRKNENNFIIKLFLNFVNGIIAVNQDLLIWARTEFPKKKSVLIKNFPFLKFDGSFERSKYVIVHLANLKHPKDHLTLVEAVGIAKTKTDRHFEVWCIGKDFNDAYSEKVKLKIEEGNLTQTIKILGSVENTSQLLQHAALGVLCSEFEGLPVSLLEYGLAGLPVIVTNVGQCAEVAGNGLYATVVEPSNPVELGAALVWHITNQDESARFGLIFKEHVIKEYGSKKFFEDYMKFINAL